MPNSTREPFFSIDPYSCMAKIIKPFKGRFCAFSVGLPFRQIIDVVLDVVEDQFERQFRIDDLHFFCGSVDATPPGERVIGFFHGENLTF
jgi:hypothetical protein